MLRSEKQALKRSEVLVMLLNEDPAKAERGTREKQRRILELLEMCRALQARIAVVRQWPASSVDFRGPQIVTQIKQRLVRYKSVPAVDIAGPDHKLVVSSRALPLRLYDKRQESEVNLVRVLLDLLNTGLIDRLRKCPCPCEKWFVAYKSDKTFRLESCRQKTFRSTPDFKESRRAYMRKYRNGLRERKHTRLRREQGERLRKREELEKRLQELARCRHSPHR
jgi:hypothetical protein